MKLNEWKCGMDINDVDIYVEPTGTLNDMIKHFGLKYNPCTGSYDCDGDANLYDYYNDLSVNEQMEFDKAFVRNGEMTIKFGTVKGCFVLPGDYQNKYILTSLKGCPKTIGRDFSCSSNQLTSLEGCPENVGGGFWCDCNQLTLLEGCPKIVGGSFNCCHNRLTSLEGCPESVSGDFDCEGNQLTSLEGCPESVGGYFGCNDNQLTSLEGCPKNIGWFFNCRYNQLTSLEGCPEKVGGVFDCRNNKTKFTTKDVTAVCDVKSSIFV